MSAHTNTNSAVAVLLLAELAADDSRYSKGRWGPSRKATATIVARRLRTLGVRGNIAGSQCPVAKYLSRHGLSAYVGYGAACVQEALGLSKSIALPKPVTEFVMAFDCGAHPELF